LKTFLSDGKNTCSVLKDWMNRPKGFELLEQYSDGENESSNSNAADNSDDETIKPIM